MKKILFGYSIGSFFSPEKGRRISLYEDNSKYVAECWPPGLLDRIDAEEPYYTMVDLSKEVIDKIMKVYSDNQDIFDINDTECTPVMDGIEYTFDFSDGTRETHIFAQNIICFFGEKSAEKIEKVLKTFAEVAKILVDAGVDKEMLML